MARKKVDTRRIKCDVCGHKHYIKDGGWVYLASKKTICYSINRRGCYEQMQALWANKVRPAQEKKGSLDIRKEFESW
jgi:hypothetical protein